MRVEILYILLKKCTFALLIKVYDKRQHGAPHREFIQKIRQTNGGK